MISVMIMGVLRKFVAALAVLTGALAVGACLATDRPYWDIRPVHHVRNSPVPVPWPVMKPRPPAPLAARQVSRPAPAPTPVSGAQTVRVERGDTVYGIARSNGVSLSDLIALNDLKPPYTLAVGQRLRVPGARMHVVRRGETAFAIAQMHDVSLSELATANRLRPPYTLHPGQSLAIPSSRGEEVEVAARAPRSLPSPPRSAGGFDWPTTGVIVSGFGPKEGGLRNDGINIAAPAGTEVLAADSGVVAYAGDGIRSFGNLVLIRHDTGYVTAYGHNAKLLVTRGDRVQRGQAIAQVGSTGSVAEPQLHFEIRKGRQAVDPIGLLPRRRAAVR